MIVSSYSFGFRKTKSKPNLCYHCTITFRSKNLLLKLLRRGKGMFKMNLMFKESTCSSLENIVAMQSFSWMLENALGYIGWFVDNIRNEKVTNSPISQNKAALKKYVESFQEGRDVVALKRN